MTGKGRCGLSPATRLSEACLGRRGAGGADKWACHLTANGRRWKDGSTASSWRVRPASAMPRPALPEPVAAGVAAGLGRGKPMCGGCGIRSGTRTLRRRWPNCRPARRCDLGRGRRRGGAAPRHQHAGLTTDHVRAFTEDPGSGPDHRRSRAGGHLVDGRPPQAALVQVILRMAPRLQSETLREIMAGAAGRCGRGCRCGRRTHEPGPN